MTESPHSHWSQCLRNVRAHAADLRRNKVRNLETLLRSYVEQPAYYPEWRDELVRLALEPTP